MNVIIFWQYLAALPCPPQFPTCISISPAYTAHIYIWSSTPQCYTCIIVLLLAVIMASSSQFPQKFSHLANICPPASRCQLVFHTKLGWPVITPSSHSGFFFNACMTNSYHSQYISFVCLGISQDVHLWGLINGGAAFEEMFYGFPFQNWERSGFLSSCF